jgi:hypothetical protein
VVAERYKAPARPPTFREVEDAHRRTRDEQSFAILQVNGGHVVLEAHVLERGVARHADKVRHPTFFDTPAAAEHNHAQARQGGDGGLQSHSLDRRAREVEHLESRSKPAWVYSLCCSTCLPIYYVLNIKSGNERCMCALSLSAQELFKKEKRRDKATTILKAVFVFLLVAVQGPTEAGHAELGGYERVNVGQGDTGQAQADDVGTPAQQRAKLRQRRNLRRRSDSEDSAPLVVRRP